MRKKIKVINKKELESFNTKQLLGRLKKLHKCEESYEMSDLFSNNEKSLDDLYPCFIHYKKTKKWLEAYDDVKYILSQREHIPKK